MPYYWTMDLMLRDYIGSILGVNYLKMELLLDKFSEKMSRFVRNPAVKEILNDIYVYDMDAPTSAEIDPSCTIGIARQTELKDLVDVVYMLKLNHVVCSERDNFFYEVFSSALMLKYPVKFLAKPYVFFLDKKSNPCAGTQKRMKSFEFTNSAAKPKVMKAIDSFIKEQRATSRLRDKLLTISDELIANALFDAPVDENKQKIYHNLNRSNYVSYEQGKVANITLAHDEENIIITCTDPYGSLDEEALKSRLFEIYYKGNTSPLLSSGGKGLGISMIWENCCSIYFAIEKYKQTFVACFFPLGKGRKEVELTPKNFHYCEF